MGEERKLKILRKVRRELTKENRFICLEIIRADNYLGSQSSKELRDYIEFALEDCPTYPHWLVYSSLKRCFIGLFLGYGFHAGRIAWVDAMIDALEHGRELPKEPVAPSWLTWRGAAKHLIAKFRRNATC